MATIIELLEALNTKEAAVSTADLASELKASKEGTLKQLAREKDKGNVDGTSQEGWLITDAGRKALEKGEIHPSMVDEEVTPRDQFVAIGRRVGEKEQRIVLATDIVWSEDYEDIKWVWEALQQADIALDKRRVWVNAWRAKLQKGIPPELEVELTSISKEAGAEAGKGGVSRAKSGRDYSIQDDVPVFCGENLGDYSLQDAKDILGLRALKARFSGAGQGGAGQGGAAGAGATGEKVSDLLRELAPYLINKGGNDETLRELLTTQMELQEQKILSRIPQPGQPSQPKSWVEQITEFAAAMGSLKSAGPLLRSIFGTPEPSSGNPGTGTPVQLTGPDGQPITMDLGQVIDWKRFQGEERRADERQTTLAGLAQTARENVPDAIQAVIAVAEEAKRGTGAKTPPASQAAEQRQMYKCFNPECGFEFPMPAGEWLVVACPQCGKEYTREEVMGA